MRAVTLILMASLVLFGLVGAANTLNSASVSVYSLVNPTVSNNTLEDASTTKDVITVTLPATITCTIGHACPESATSQTVTTTQFTSSTSTSTVTLLLNKTTGQTLATVTRLTATMSQIAVPNTSVNRTITGLVNSTSSTISVLPANSSTNMTFILPTLSSSSTNNVVATKLYQNSSMNSTAMAASSSTPYWTGCINAPAAASTTYSSTLEPTSTAIKTGGAAEIGGKGALVMVLGLAVLL